MHIKIGTRGSKLALWQSEYVAQKLETEGINSEIVIIETKGDKILDRALSKIGSKGLFTAELEEQLRNGSIDIAVHSAKDLQSVLEEDLEIIAFGEREAMHDVLISYNPDIRLSQEGIRVGTSSTRRVALLKHYYPAVQTLDIRGNLQTRLAKLEAGDYDAIILAYAGVKRMGYENLIVEHLPLSRFVPAVGQGSVAIEASKILAFDKREAIYKAINHTESEDCLRAERAFLRTMQGGCSIPVFGLAQLINTDDIHLEVGIISLDGKDIIRKEHQARRERPEILGRTLAKQLLEAGGKEILADIRQQLG